MLKMFKAKMFVASVLMVLSSALMANTITIDWSPSTNPDVAGYKVYWGGGEGDYAFMDAQDDTSVVIDNLDDSDLLYFTVKTYNAARTIETNYTARTPYVTPAANQSYSLYDGGYAVMVGQRLADPNVVKWVWSFPGSKSPKVTRTNSNAFRVFYDNTGLYQVSVVRTFADGSTTTEASTLKIARSNSFTIAP